MIIIDRFCVALFILLAFDFDFFNRLMNSEIGYLLFVIYFLFFIRVLFILIFFRGSYFFEKVLIYLELFIFLSIFFGIYRYVNIPVSAFFLYCTMLSILFLHFFIFRGFIDKRHAIKNIRPSNFLYFIAGMERDNDKDDLN